MALLLAEAAGAMDGLQLLSASAREVQVAALLPADWRAAVNGPGPTALALPGGVRPAPGAPNIPYLATLVAVPAGARVEVDTDLGPEVTIDGLNPGVVPGEPDAGLAATTPATAAAPVAVQRLGILRGVEAWSLQARPYTYDAATRRLHVYPDLRVRLRFVGGSVGRYQTPAPASPLYEPFVNRAQAPAYRVPPPTGRPSGSDWYDPTAPWVKVEVASDGVFRLDPDWLRDFADPATIDPRTLRLLWQGNEEPLVVFGEADGRFDPGDYLLFCGRYRRDDRDSPSLYGALNVYWLTWGGAPGRRYESQSAAPQSDLPWQRTFADTLHYEQDVVHDPLPYAADANRDHWFWRQVAGTSATLAGSATFIADLPAADLVPGATVGFRIALHGSTDMAHHTLVKLNGGAAIVDTVWGRVGDGQRELVVDRTVAAEELAEGVNFVLLQALADQAKVDWTYLNWFEIRYLRRFAAANGYLAFAVAPSTGRRIVVDRLRRQRLEVLDPAHGVRLVGLQTDSSAVGVQVAFTESGSRAAHYVVSDTTAWQTPRGQRDVSSNWRTPEHAADYLVITHPANLEGAETLAEHRRAAGLTAAVVSTEDLYDEFTYGRLDSTAVAAFIRYAYHQWNVPPTYVLLYGDDTHDYRGVEGAGVPAAVPGPFYQSRGRGLAPSDYLLSLVDGDDLLPDLAVGRLPVASPLEAVTVAAKVIAYDRDPEPGAWQDKVLFLANYHPLNLFTAPCDSLARRYVEPAGMTSVKVYSPNEDPLPNPMGRAFLQALNQGALLMNFSGHGSAGALQYVFALELPDWGYLAQVRNGRRLPLVLALSCLNGMYTNPTVESMAEAFTTLPEGGAIAYISATAKSFVAQNDLLAEFMYDELLPDRRPAFGPALATAKTRLLAAHSGWGDAALTMQLFGDPAQHLIPTPGPDLSVDSLGVAPAAVVGRSTVRVRAVLHQRGPQRDDSVRVVLLARDPGLSAETLAVATLPPWSGDRAIEFPWSVGARRGACQLELEAGLAQADGESDLTNNRRAVTVEVLEPLTATPVRPRDGAVVATDSLELLAAVPLTGGPYSCQFELTRPDSGSAWTSTWLAASDGAATCRAPAAVSQEGAGARRWRVRLTTAAATGPWSDYRAVTLASTSAPGWWTETASQAAPVTGLVRREDSRELSDATLPCRLTAAGRDTGFTVRGVAGAGVVCSDGRYLYAKRWFNDASTLYPGNDLFTRIGSGLGNTYQSANFGPVADTTTAGMAATWHSDGFIYSECGRAFQLERIDPASGRLDTVSVPDGLAEWRSGRITDGHTMITSDGRWIYNVAMSSPAGARSEWSVRVFDPASDWALVREFTSPPTETGFTYEWTDGVIADGERLYLLEYGGQHRIRMIDAVNGAFLDEWVGDQAETRVISGQYDWVNNKVWLGDLFASAIYRYQGPGKADSALAWSPPLGPAAHWEALTTVGQAGGPGGLRIDVCAESGDGGWAPLPGLTDLAPGATVDLRHIDPMQNPRLRLRAAFVRGQGGGRLESWSVAWRPRPSLQLAQAEAVTDPAGQLAVRCLVRNLAAEASDGAALVLTRTDAPGHERRQVLPPLASGATVAVTVDSVPLPTGRARLFASVVSSDPDADPTDDRRELAVFMAGHAPVTLTRWPDQAQFVSGDPLRSDQGLLIAAPDIVGAVLHLKIDGVAVAADSTVDLYPALGPALLWRPHGRSGRCRLQVEVERDGVSLGASQLEVNVVGHLGLGSVLVYPQPVRDQGAITLVLSEPAEVEVRIYAVSGRGVRVLGPQALDAGFAALPWDGRDDAGGTVAGGTYPFVVRARAAGGGEAIARGVVVVVR
jgi:hypothetical protein